MAECYIVPLNKDMSVLRYEQLKQRLWLRFIQDLNSPTVSCLTANRQYKVGKFGPERSAGAILVYLIFTQNSIQEGYPMDISHAIQTFKCEVIGLCNLIKPMVSMILML